MNTGIYLFQPEIFSLIPSTGPYDFGRELFPKLVELKAAFYGYQMEGYWSDIGSIDAYRESCLDAIAGKIKLSFDATRLNSEVSVQGPVKIHPQAQIKGPVLLGAGTIIEEGAELEGPLCVGAGTHIKRNARLVRSVLWEEVVVGEGATCREAIVASGGEICPGAVVNKTAVAAGALVEEVAECDFCG